VFQQLKSFLVNQLGIPPSAALVVLGCAAHLALNTALKKSPGSAWGLLAPLLLGLGLESYEIWHHYRDIGLYAPGNDPLSTILARHSLDIVKMLAAPSLLVVLVLIYPTST
jgi:hypothetical protein